MISRYWQKEKGSKFTEISIDPDQPVRKSRKLLDYIPLFPGYYELYRSYEFNGFLMEHYDDPKVQNKSFYGTLNKVLQFRDGIAYQNVIILMIKDSRVYTAADESRVRFFSDIAVKPGIPEYAVKNRGDLSSLLSKHISGSNISGEIDLNDDGNRSISMPSDVECIIVDNDVVASVVRKTFGTTNCPHIFVSSLPRNDPGQEDFEI
ncbi:MAG: hypothetical protein ABSE82_15930 [Nitrososphaerales archaeon]